VRCGDKPAIFLGSRNQYEDYDDYCDEDEDSPLGSGGDNRSSARYNVVLQNRILERALSDMIRIGTDGSNIGNYIALFDDSGFNETVSSAPPRPAGCYTAKGYKRFFAHGDEMGVDIVNGEPTCGGQRTCSDGEWSKPSRADCSVRRVVAGVPVVATTRAAGESPGARWGRESLAPTVRAISRARRSTTGKSTESARFDSTPSPCCGRPTIPKTAGARSATEGILTGTNVPIRGALDHNTMLIRCLGAKTSRPSSQTLNDRTVARASTSARLSASHGGTTLTTPKSWKANGSPASGSGNRDRASAVGIDDSAAARLETRPKGPSNDSGQTSEQNGAGDAQGTCRHLRPSSVFSASSLNA
jgi:hypothetical protein